MRSSVISQKSKRDMINNYFNLNNSNLNNVSDKNVCDDKSQSELAD